MPTAKVRMLQLSSLPTGNSARAHFLSIVGITVFSDINMLLKDEAELLFPLKDSSEVSVLTQVSEQAIVFPVEDKITFKSIIEEFDVEG